MRKSTGLMMLLLLSFGLQAQTWDEWFEQRKTQRKYLVQQIEALQVYLGYLEQGYEIAGAGLNTVNSIKNGDFNLHNGYFNSLKSVKPSIGNSAAVVGIVIMQRQIVKRGKLAVTVAKETNQFTSAELSQMKLVVDRLLEDCAGTLEELVMLITSGELEMKDDERIRRIDGLRAGMESKYKFCRSFADDMSRLAMQRMAEQREVNRSKLIFGLN